MKHHLVVRIAALLGLCVAGLAADITGHWVENEDGKVAASFDFKQVGSTLTGSHTGVRSGATEQLANGKVEGGSVSFEFTADRGAKGKVLQKWSGTVDGGVMKLKVDTGQGEPREITITRQ